MAASRIVGVAILTAVGMLVAPSGAAVASPASSSAATTAVRADRQAAVPSPTPSNGPGGNEQQPSPEEVSAEQRRAAALLREVDRRAGDVAQARAELDQASRSAALALEQFTSALVASRAAQLEADRQDQLLLQSQLTLAAQKAVLGRWARQAYGEGELGVNPALGTILDGGSTDDLGRALTYLRRVGDSKGRAVEDYAAAVRIQARAATTAEAGRVQARDASEAAAAAREAADAAVTAQRTEVDALEALLASAQDAASDAQTKASNLADARVVAQARAAAGSGANLVTGRTGDCRGGDVSAYDNGQIPLAVLCPLWGTSNHFLRADAAYAFDRLSQAYAQRFGEPICITDSYRDYDTQVRLYAEKPNLAAVPGTSNHGRGTATDLCGGVQDFGTPTHNWLLVNAPQFGWFHPAWAEPNGSRPEPWHWEFAG
jgi:hypothetical protein